MKENWKTIPFEKSIEKVKYTTKIPSSDYKRDGKYPVVSQEEGLISGYWNNDEDVFHIQHPIVVFGDHTRILKYIDFDFVLGADGVKILSPVEGLNAKFFCHYLQWYKIPSLGYSRHFKLLKEISVPIPPLPEQESIVKELDLLSGIIEKKKQQLKELDNLAQSIFYEMFGDPITNEKGWEVKKLGDVCKKIYAGGDVPSRHYSVSTKEYSIPIFSNGLEDNGLYGFTDVARETERCITIAGRGVNVGKAILRDIPFFPVIRLVVAVPNTDYIIPDFFCHCVNLLGFTGNGGAIPQLTCPMVREKSIILPNLSLQQSFAAKIEAIEKQKELIKQSIKETETLFNSRMDYYFN